MLHRTLVFGGAAYLAFLIALLIPVIQRNVIFLHNVPYPFFPAFQCPHKHGLAPFKARNLNISTTDGEHLGAWHILPGNVYTDLLTTYPPTEPFSNHTFDQALHDRPTVLFLHGNAASRAAPFRVNLVTSLANTLNVNVLALDYRGFADSSGTPSEQGLILDARAAFDWILDRNGGRPEQVDIVGQSLGTGVGAKLVDQLVRQDLHPHLLALLSPYSSIPSLLETYTLFRLFPILSPLRFLPRAQTFFTSPRFLPTRLDTLATLTVLPPSRTTVLIAHAQDDGEIPSTHSRRLFDGMLDRAMGLGELGVFPLDGDGWDEHLDRVRERGISARERTEIVEVPGWAVVSQFQRDGGGKVVWVDAERGGHDSLGGSEGIVQMIGELWKA